MKENESKKTFHPTDLKKILEELLIKKVDRALANFRDDEFKKVFANI